MVRRREIWLNGAVNIMGYALRKIFDAGGSGLYLLPFSFLKVNAISERATLRNALFRIVPWRQTYIR